MSKNQETKRSRLRVYAQIKPVQQMNDGFTLCECRVHGLGKNRNMTYLSKENTLRNLYTLPYVPVVGHLIPKEDGGYYMGGHDFEIDWETMEIKPLTVPVGVVVDNGFWFDYVEEYGERVEYLCCNLILWTGRYPELKEAIYSPDVWFNESMELDVAQWRPLESDSNYTEFLDWTYSALCLLGKSDSKEHPEWHTEPCFISSDVRPVSYQLDTEFRKAVDEMRKCFALYFAQNSEKGGKGLNTEKVTEILAELKLSCAEPEQLAQLFDTEEALRAAFTDAAEGSVVTVTVGADGNAEASVEAPADPEPAGADPEPAGDDPEPNPEADPEPDAAKELADARAALEEATASVASLTQELEAVRSECDAFRARLEKTVIADFEDLADDEAFQRIKSGETKFNTLEELENACFALRGRKMTAAAGGKMFVGNGEPKKTAQNDRYAGILSEE